MIRRNAVTVAAVSLLAVALTSGCAGNATPPADAAPTELTVEIVRTVEHDPQAFTQGLEIAGTEIYEGTGLTGGSWIEARDAETGAPRVRVDLNPELFGEGITVDGESLWQLTWRNGVAIERDRTTLEQLRTVPIDGEGWGICLGDKHLVTSDGSATLTFRDRRSFAPVRTVQVTDENGSVEKLNELECTDDGIYANIWTSDTIVRINPDTGDVTARIDAAALRESLGIDTNRRPDDVLNGIAAIPGTDRFLVTGKRWPSMFEVRFVS